MMNNKLIAEFMGMEFGDDGTMCYDDAENRHPPTPTDMLAFHTSWDWLMPVVQKIYQLGLDNESTLLVRDAVAEANLDNTYSAVSEFIKKYTITQNQDDD
jgi:hypothetical protein